MQKNCFLSYAVLFCSGVDDLDYDEILDLYSYDSLNLHYGL